MEQDKEQEIKILSKPGGEQIVTIDGMPYNLVGVKDKIRAIGEAAKAQSGIADFIRKTSSEIMTPCTGNA